MRALEIGERSQAAARGGGQSEMPRRRVGGSGEEVPEKPEP